MASVYVGLAAARLRSVTSARTLFALRCTGDALLIFVEAVAPLVLVHRFGSIAGWSAPEVLLLVGVGRVGEGLALTVARGVEPTTFGETVRRGRFDQVLTRPVSPLGWLLTTEIEVRHLFRALAGAVILVLAGSAAGVRPTPANVVTLVAACVSCTVFVLCVLVVGAALTFRTVEGSDIATLAVNGGIALVSFPLDLYGGALRFVFTFLLPVGIFVYVPVLAVLDRDGPGVLGPGLLPWLPVATLAFVAAAAVAWRAGLRRYQSTGS